MEENTLLAIESPLIEHVSYSLLFFNVLLVSISVDCTS